MEKIHSLEEVHSDEIFREDMALKYRNDRDRLVKLIGHELEDKTAAKVDVLYRGIFSNKDLMDINKAFVHNDFSCSHILYDMEKKRVSGIIDFGDSCVTDVDNDFYCLLEEAEEELGRDFGLKVLSYYGYEDVDRLLRKADFHESYWCVEQILYGYEYGYDDWIRQGMERIRSLEVIHSLEN